MPCDSVRTQSVAFQQAHLHLLKPALEEMGYKIVSEYGKSLSFTKDGQQYRYANGQFEAPTNARMDVNAIKRAYSKELMSQAAKKNGYQVNIKENQRDKKKVKLQIWRR